MTPFQMAWRVIAQTRPIGVIQTQAAGERRLADMPMANPVQAVKVTWAKGENRPLTMKILVMESQNLMK